MTGDYEKLEVKDVKETLSANELAVYAEDDWTVNHFIRLNAGCPRSKLEQGVQRLIAGINTLL